MSHGLPMPAGADGDALEAFTSQPGLFTGLDCDLPTVSGARQFLHTGSTVSKHEQDAARIVAAASLNWSVRKIARELGHSRNTVSAVLRLAEQAGKVEPVSKRVLAAAAAAIHQDIETGNALLDEAETAQDISAAAALRRSTWVGAGILADKGAPAVASITVNVGAGSVVQVVQDYAKELAALAAADSASVGNLSFAALSDGSPVIDAGHVVGGGSGLANGPETWTAAGGTAQGGAGGVCDAGDGGNTDGTT